MVVLGSYDLGFPKHHMMQALICLFSSTRALTLELHKSAYCGFGVSRKIRKSNGFFFSFFNNLKIKFMTWYLIVILKCNGYFDFAFG